MTGCRWSVSVFRLQPQAFFEDHICRTQAAQWCSASSQMLISVFMSSQMQARLCAACSQACVHRTLLSRAGAQPSSAAGHAGQVHDALWQAGVQGMPNWNLYD